MALHAPVCASSCAQMHMKVEWDWQNLQQSLTALVRRHVSDGRHQRFNAHPSRPSPQHWIQFQGFSFISSSVFDHISHVRIHFVQIITTRLFNYGRYDNCLTRTANNDAVKCFCVVSCLWIVGW